MPSKRSPATHGVLIAGVHLTYPSRATANRVRKVLRAYVAVRSQATRGEIEIVARLAIKMPGHRAVEIAADAWDARLSKEGRPEYYVMTEAFRSAMPNLIRHEMKKKMQGRKGKAKSCR